MCDKCKCKDCKEKELEHKIEIDRIKREIQAIKEELRRDYYGKAV